MEKNDNNVLEYIINNPSSSSKEIYEGSKLDIGYATLKRILNRLHESNFLDIEGRGRGTKYKVSQAYSIIKPIDIEEYFKKEIDEREINGEFNLELIPKILDGVELFTASNFFPRRHQKSLGFLKFVTYTKEKTARWIAEWLLFLRCETYRIELCSRKTKKNI